MSRTSQRAAPCVELRRRISFHCSPVVETKEEAMKHSSRSVALTGLAVSLVASLGAVSPQAAAAECSSKAAGTYLMTFTQGENRDTFRLGDDGTVTAADSLQGTVGFTAAQGTWGCKGKDLVE